jgi:hypothetical protein
MSIVAAEYVIHSLPVIGTNFSVIGSILRVGECVCLVLIYPNDCLSQFQYPDPPLSPFPCAS